MEYVFETGRLRARAFVPGDAERLYEIHLDEEVKKWFPNESYQDAQEAGEAAVFFADCVKAGRLPCVLAVELKRTGELIGDAGINEADGKPEEIEVGYVICRELRGQGYATELLGGLTEYAASAFGVKSLFGRVVNGNGASVRVLEKNGYGFVAEESGAEDDPYGHGMLVYMKNTRPNGA